MDGCAGRSGSTAGSICNTGGTNVPVERAPDTLNSRLRTTKSPPELQLAVLAARYFERAVAILWSDLSCTSDGREEWNRHCRPEPRSCCGCSARPVLNGGRRPLGLLRQPINAITQNKRLIDKRHVVASFPTAGNALRRPWLQRKAGEHWMVARVRRIGFCIWVGVGICAMAVVATAARRGWRRGTFPSRSFHMYQGLIHPHLVFMASCAEHCGLAGCRIHRLLLVCCAGAGAE